jgi:hypothetical protein
MAQSKKIVYFLGAGASYGAGAYAPGPGTSRVPIPTQSTFWETFLKFSDSENRSAIESFLFRYFMSYAKVPYRLNARARYKLLAGIDVEEVFTFLSERARAPSTTPQLRTYANKIWRSLVREITNVFSRFEANTRTRNLYRQLLTNHYRSFDSFVSFNYDTIFEDSLPGKSRACYLGISQPRSTSIPLLKPHGSVNWTIRSGRIVVDSGAETGVVVAPTHLKFVSIGHEQAEMREGYLDQFDEIQHIWTAMEREMKSARALVFIGYSFPVADLYFASVLRTVIADREYAPDVVVVNPDAVAISERLRRRFALSNVIKYFELSQFVRATRTDVLAQLS